MNKAKCSQNKKVLLYVSIITVFHSKMLLQAGAETKPAVFTLERSDYSRCPKHLAAFYAMTSQTHMLGIISKQQNTVPEQH